MNLICRLFGHKELKKKVTKKNYRNFIIPCLRCKQSIRKTIRKLSSPVRFDGDKINFIIFK